MGEMKGDDGSKMVGRKEQRPSAQDNCSFWRGPYSKGRRIVEQELSGEARSTREEWGMKRARWEIDPCNESNKMQILHERMLTCQTFVTHRYIMVLLWWTAFIIMSIAVPIMASLSIGCWWRRFVEIMCIWGRGQQACTSAAFGTFT
jgi:hypothetical protein